MKAEVFRNREERVWAVRAVEGPYRGRVIFSTNEILLADVHISVNQRRKSDAIRTGTAKVHTTLVGDIEEAVGFVPRFVSTLPYSVHSVPLVSVPEAADELVWSESDQALFYKGRDGDASETLFKSVVLLQDGTAWAIEEKELL